MTREGFSYARGVELLTTLRQAESFVAARLAADLAAPIVLVPTMGALHAGHASLVRQGAALAAELNRGLSAGASSAVCVATIFVNPTQFNDPGDLARYPRTLEADLRLCEASGAAAVWAPGVADVYPGGVSAPAAGGPALPAVASAPGLEDRHRPGHFAGVCRVVDRLFAVWRPRLAIFGEKDWQQLAVIRAMVDAARGADAGAAGSAQVRVVPGPTVREPDGLAMSSRNVFLSVEDRRRAGAIPRALQLAAREATVGAAEAAMRRELEAAGLRVEYAVVRDAATLMPAESASMERPMRSLIAVSVGGESAGRKPVRLIDNAAWSPAGG